MAKKTDRISIRKFEALLDKHEREHDMVSIPLGDDGDVNVTIKRTLSLTEMLSFVEEVVDSCVDVGTGDYTPEIYDFVIRTNILTKYANFAMPNNVEKHYELIYNTDVVEQVIPYINEKQFKSIIEAIDRKIKFALDVVSSSAVSKINEVINQMNNIASISEEAFSGVDPSMITNVIQNLGQLNEDEKIVRALLNANKSEDN